MGEKKYFPERYCEFLTKEKWNNSKEFIDDIMERKDTLWDYEKNLYDFYNYRTNPNIRYIDHSDFSFGCILLIFIFCNQFKS